MSSLLKPCTSWDTVSNFHYAPGTNQVLDAYLPKGNGTTTNPLIVVVHGGAWDSGTEDFDWYTALLLSGVVRRGFAVASVRYRLSGEAIWPAQIQDVLAAVRELRAKASTWRIWPDKIGLWGMSAGAQLTALAGVAGTDPAFQPTTRPGVSNEVAAAVSDFPPTDFRSFVTTPGFTSLQQPSSYVSRLFGAPVLTIPAKADAASPALRVTPAAPPLWLRHGTADTTVPISQSRELRDAYLAAGAPVTLTEKSGAQHADAAFYTTAEVGVVGDWFDAHLRP